MSGYIFKIPLTYLELRWRNDTLLAKTFLVICVLVNRKSLNRILRIDFDILVNYN